MPEKSATLVSGCINGDRKAQNELYAILNPILSNVCSMYCKTKEDTEDAVAEAFVRIFDNLWRYEGSSMAELVGWCKTIAKHKAIDKVNADATDKRKGVNVGYEDAFNDQACVRNMASPDREFILALLVQMPKNPRKVFIMHEIEGYSYDELTIMLGMKMNALKTNYHRARKWLMARIEADWKKAGIKK